MAKHNVSGRIGEDIASKWCRDHHLTIVARNYRKSFGEIDIVARETNQCVHFIEVKTVSYETRSDLYRAVSYGTWRPEEKVDKSKQYKLKRMIEAWLREYGFCDSWQVDILAVRMIPREKYAVVTHIENVVFD